MGGGLHHQLKSWSLCHLKNLLDVLLSLLMICVFSFSFNTFLIFHILPQSSHSSSSFTPLPSINPPSLLSLVPQEERRHVETKRSRVETKINAWNKRNGEAEQKRRTDHLKFFNWENYRKKAKKKKQGCWAESWLQGEHCVPATQNPKGSNPNLNLNLNPAPGLSYFRLLWKH